MNGEAIRRLRRQRKLTQRAFGRAVGINPNTLARWERNALKPSGTARRLLMLLERQTASIVKQEERILKLQEKLTVLRAKQHQMEIRRTRNGKDQG